MPSTDQPQESIADAFRREVKEVLERVERGDRLLGFALAIVIDEGRTVVDGWSLERHDGGLADERLRQALEDARAEIDADR